MIALDIVLQQERMYIKHFNGRLKNGSLYVGWVKSKFGEPVDEKDVKMSSRRTALELGAPIRGIIAFTPTSM